MTISNQKLIYNSITGSIHNNNNNNNIKNISSENSTMSGSSSSTSSSTSTSSSLSANNFNNKYSTMSHSLSAHNQHTAVSYRSVIGTPIHNRQTTNGSSQKYTYKQQHPKLLTNSATVSKSNGKLYNSHSTESLSNLINSSENIIDYSNTNRKSAFHAFKSLKNNSSSNNNQRTTYQYKNNLPLETSKSYYLSSTNSNNTTTNNNTNKQSVLSITTPNFSQSMNYNAYSNVNKAKLSLQMQYENMNDIKNELSINKLTTVTIDCDNNQEQNESNFEQKFQNTNLSMRSTVASSSLLNSPSISSNSLMNPLQFFSHFDVQSILFDYNEVKLNKDSLHTSINTRTGASAASRQGSMENLNKLALLETQIISSSASSSTSSSTSSSSQIILDKYCNSTSVTNSPRQSLTNNNAKQDSQSNELVQSCPYFRLEIGGDAFKGLGLGNESQRRFMKLNSLTILDRIDNNYFKKELIDNIRDNLLETFSIEYQDYGAFFYRYYFFNQEHVNYFGHDREIGPVAISIKRDKNIYLLNESNNNSSQHRSDYVYRFIMRTSELYTLRGTISEDHIPTKQSSINNTKGISHREIINFLIPQLDINCLRVAESKANEKLLQLDEQYIVKNHKIGILLCKAGQSTEEEMYNNIDSTPAFDEFINLLGDTVTLKNFSHYKGGLDTKTDTTGTTSVYTKFRDKEIMFHVSTMLPFTQNDRQQLTRKRHIGNDVVTIIFQEEGSLPFSPKNIRSHFQHIFIIVRVLNPNTPNTQYSVAISYNKDIPTFGPPLPKNPLFIKSNEFRNFLLTKIINADNAGLRCDKFVQMRMRARNGALKDLVLNYCTKTTLESSSRFGLFNFGSIKQKKLRSKSLQIFSSSDTLLLNGGIFWYADIEDNTNGFTCYFGISEQNIVAVDQLRKSVVFNVSCNAIIGWTINDLDNSLVIYFDHGEYIHLHLKCKLDLQQVLKRLEYFTKGTKTIELSLEKKDYGQLGFSIHHDGVVSEVEPYSLAYYRGLKQGTRIVKIMDNYVSQLNHEKMIDLLRKSLFLKVTFLPPFDDGSPRRGLDTEAYSLYSYLSTCSSLNERSIDLNNSNSSSNKLKTYTNGVYFGYDTLPLNGTKTQLQSQSATAVLQSHKTNGFKNSTTSINRLIHNQCDNEEQPTSHSNGYGKLTANNTLEWSKLVQTATKAFENAHRSSDSLYYSDYLYNNGKVTTTNELLSNPNYISNSQLTINELKEALNRVTSQLEQEKIEKQQYKSKMTLFMEENKTLRQELVKVKDENKNLSKKLYELFNMKNAITHHNNSNIFAAFNK